MRRQESECLARLWHTKWRGSLKAVQLNVRRGQGLNARMEQQRSTAHADESSQITLPCPNARIARQEPDNNKHNTTFPPSFLSFHFVTLPLPPVVCGITYQAVLTGVTKLPPLAEGETHVHALQTVPHLAGRRAHKGHDDAVVVVGVVVGCREYDECGLVDVYKVGCSLAFRHLVMDAWRSCEYSQNTPVMPAPGAQGHPKHG